MSNNLEMSVEMGFTYIGAGAIYKLKWPEMVS